MVNSFPAIAAAYVLLLSSDHPKLYSRYTYSEKARGTSALEYQTMNDSAAEVLSLCSGKRKVSEIIKALSDKYSEPIPKTKVYVEEFLETCLSHGYIQLHKEPINLEKRIIGDSQSVIPITAAFEITKKCPLRCKHCYNNSGLPGAKELTYEEVKLILGELEKTGVQKVTITGGEPFARQDSIDIIREASKRFIGVMIGSNGFYIDDRVSLELGKINKRNGNIALQISIDGMEKAHDEIRGVIGSFSKAVESIRLCKKNQLPVLVSMTLNDSNYKDIDEVAEMCLALKVDQLTLSATVEQGRAKGNNLLRNIGIEEIFSSIKRAKKKYLPSGLYISLDEELITRYENGLPLNYCGAGIDLIAVRENGDISPCVAYPLILGNMLNSSLKEILNSEKTNLLKKIAPPSDDLCDDCELLELNCRGCNARALDLGEGVCSWAKKNSVFLKRVDSNV